MDSLVYLKSNDIFTDSLVIAKGTNVEHRKIKTVIRKHEKKFEEFGKLSAPYQAESKGGRPIEYYPLNEAQATFLVTLLKNTDVVVNFKAELVRQFYEMRKLLAERNTKDWIETRQQGKMTRKSETDVIKELVEYAKDQGSTHSHMLYMTYSKLANRMVGIKGKERDFATTIQLNNLNIFENIILNLIRVGMSQEMDYHDIYRLCESRCVQAKEVAMIGG